MNKLAVIGGIVAIGLLGALLVEEHQYTHRSVEQQNLGSFQVNYNNFATVSTSVITTSQSNMIVATNTGRTYLRIEALGGGIWLAYGTSTAVTGSNIARAGEFLPASTTITFNLDNMYTGPIFAQADIQTVTTTIIEFSRRGGAF